MSKKVYYAARETEKEIRGLGDTPEEALKNATKAGYDSDKLEVIKISNCIFHILKRGGIVEMEENKHHVNIFVREVSDDIEDKEFENEQNV